jgi:plasmid stabilization system protein ParE
VARTVAWTEAATRDLSEAAEFIARDSRFYATALVREARIAARSLKSLADRGRAVPEARSLDVRELFVKSYRLIYRITPDTIVVIAFVHGARDLRRLWNHRGGVPG